MGGSKDDEFRMEADAAKNILAMTKQQPHQAVSPFNWLTHESPGQR